MKICGVYKITNTITGDFYIGSSKDVKQRWMNHKKPSRWKAYPNNPMYQDIQKYGVDKFVFEILAEIEEGSLKETEQEFIKKLQPTYNDRNADGWNTERLKESKRKAKRKYQKTEKGKEYKKEYRKTHRDEINEYQKKYRQSDKYKESQKKYKNQLCIYNGEKITLAALSARLRKAGIDHPTQEAKKYLIL